MSMHADSLQQKISLRHLLLVCFQAFLHFIQSFHQGAEGHIHSSPPITTILQRRPVCESVIGLRSHNRFNGRTGIWILNLLFLFKKKKLSVFWNPMLNTVFFSCKTAVWNSALIFRCMFGKVIFRFCIGYCHFILPLTWLIYHHFFLSVFLRTCKVP